MKRKWLAAALAAALWTSGASAGELTIDMRIGNTDLRVDGDRLSSGEDVSKGQLSTGFSITYRWPRGVLLDAGFTRSTDIFPLFGFDDLDHQWLGVGWQVNRGNAYFTPKVGITHTRLRSLQENIFEGGEPVDEFKDVVPYIEATFEYRAFGRFGTGLYLRKNFEKFGSSDMFGFMFGWTFK